jgi:hypothetical protein
MARVPARSNSRLSDLVGIRIDDEKVTGKARKQVTIGI